MAIIVTRASFTTSALHTFTSFRTLEENEVVFIIPILSPTLLPTRWKATENLFQQQGELRLIALQKALIFGNVVEGHQSKFFPTWQTIL